MPHRRDLFAEIITTGEQWGWITVTDRPKLNFQFDH
jgi:hypothetical protein